MRPSAKELLKNPIFDEIRIKENEICADYKINIDIDKDDPLDYDLDEEAKQND